MISTARIFARTAKGDLELAGNPRLSVGLRSVLSLVDGESTVAEISARAGLSRSLLESALETLLEDGMVKLVPANMRAVSAPRTPAERPSATQPPSRDTAKPSEQNMSPPTDFLGNMMREVNQGMVKGKGAEPHQPAEMPVSIAALSKPPAALEPEPGKITRQEPAQSKDADAQAQQRARRVAADVLGRADREKKLKTEASEKAKEAADAKAKIAEEAKLRADAEAKAKEEELKRRALEAEARTQAAAAAARLKAEAEARVREEQARLKAEAEVKAKDAQLKQLALEAEARAQAAAAEARLKAEAEAKTREEQARLNVQAEFKAKEEELKRLAFEAEARAQTAAAEARLSAEAQGRAREEELKRLAIEAEARAQAATAEAKLKLEAEAKAREEEETRRRAEELAKFEAEAKAQAEADYRARLKAQEEAEAKEEELKRLAVEAKARAKAEAVEAKLKAEAEARRAEEEARLKAEAEAKAKQEELARLAREEESRRRAEEEARLKAEAEARARQEELARLAREEDARRRAEEEARLKAEAEAKARQEELARLAREEEARRRAEEEARLKAEAEAKAKQEELARVAREEAARLRAESEAKAKEEERQRLELEAQAWARAAAEDARLTVSIREEEALLEAHGKALAEAEYQARLEMEIEARDEAEAALTVQEHARRDAEEARIERSIGAKNKGEATPAPQNFDPFGLPDLSTATPKPIAPSTPYYADPYSERIEPVLDSRAKMREETQPEPYGDDEAKPDEIPARRVEREREGWHGYAPAQREPGAFGWLSRLPRLRRVRVRRRGAGIPWGKIIVLPAVFLMVVLVFTLRLIPQGALKQEAERLLTESLGQPVSIGEATVELIPTPLVRFEAVKIGNPSSVRVSMIKAVPDIAAWMNGTKGFRSVELEGVSFAPDAYASLYDGLLAARSRLKLPVRRIFIPAMAVPANGLGLKSVSAEFEQYPEGGLRKVVFTSNDGQLTVDLEPQDSLFQLTLTAQVWRLPGTDFNLETLNVAGRLKKSEFIIEDMNGRAFGGRIDGKGLLRWGDRWRLGGKFKVSGVDLDLFPAAPVISDGTLGLNGAYDATAQDSANLLSDLKISGRFSVGDGKLGIDITRALDESDKEILGGTTPFKTLDGAFQSSAKGYELRDMRLAAGPLSASGHAKLSAAKDLSGRLAATLTINQRRMQETLRLSGSAAGPRIRVE